MESRDGGHLPMKTTLVLLTIASFLGLATGIGAAYLRYGNAEAVYTFEKPALDDQGAAPTPTELRARAEVQGSNVFEFGVMSRNERRSHTYSVVNKGNDALHISFIDKSCQCTDVTISRSVVPPGETTEIELSWQPSSFNPVFEQTARFKTNDPGRIELDLTVKGRVLQILQIEPRSVSFDNVSRNQAREAGFRLFSYRDDDLEIADTEWLHPESAEFFRVDVQPLDKDTIDAEPGAVAGYDVKVQLTPGLPVGKFQQRLRLHLNYPDLGVREVPILGSIVGDISVFGSGYANELWNLGMLSGDKIHTRTLKIIVKGNMMTRSRCLFPMSTQMMSCRPRLMDLKAAGAFSSTH